MEIEQTPPAAVSCRPYWPLPAGFAVPVAAALPLPLPCRPCRAYAVPPVPADGVWVGVGVKGISCRPALLRLPGIDLPRRPLPCPVPPLRPIEQSLVSVAALISCRPCPAAPGFLYVKLFAFAVDVPPAVPLSSCAIQSLT